MLRGYQNSSCLYPWVILLSVFSIVTLKQSSGKDENFYGAKGRVNEQMVLDIKEAEREDDSLLCPSRDASPKGKLLLYFSNAKQRNLWMWKLLKPQWNIESFITTLEAPAHSLVTCKYSICFLFQIETLCLFLIIV
uniref:Uncharacterized protein n=1 Tax=Brassica oleracea var. oleracea TaxID=109376 RepID=A0A0D3A6V1_BRAOL